MLNFKKNFQIIFETNSIKLTQDKAREFVDLAKNNLKVVFCIGENKFEKKKKKTFGVLKRQLTNVLEKKFNKNNIIVAYEPIWSIGTGKIPTTSELKKTTMHIKKVLKNSVFNRECLEIDDFQNQKNHGNQKWVK